MLSTAQALGFTAVSVLLTSLITYFITTLVNRSAYAAVAKSLVKHHEQIWHQDSMYAFVEKEIGKHTKNCEAAQDIKHVKNIVLAIYVKQGGKIEELKI